MSEPTYTLEKAKSGRSKCSKSKEPIAKGELRIHYRNEDESSGRVFSRYVYDYFTATSVTILL